MGIKLNKKTILIAVIILVLVIFLVINFVKKNNNNLKLEKVGRGTVTQEVSETGIVEAADEINLGFKTSGRISQINVKVGDKVVKEAALASLDKTSLSIQLNQAQAALAVAQVQYSKTSQNAKTAAEQNLNDAYQDALNTLDDVYLKLYNAYNAVVSLQNNYFSTADQEGIKVADNKTLINIDLNALKTSLDMAKVSLNHSDIDITLQTADNSLKNTSGALKIIRDMCNQGIYYTKVSSADKTIIDNNRSYIITALTDINTSQQTISSDKIALQKAEDDIDYYQAKVEEAETNVNSCQQQIWDATIRAPISGIITKVDKKIGETVQATDLPISLISLDPFEVKVDIYEEDVVKIKLDNLVDIKIAAFPAGVLKGKIVSIDPAEKLVEGVVYYETTIAFDQIKEGLRPGMTADIIIKTMSKENVLIISKEAVRENGKITVLVLKNGKEENREIQIGLEGDDGKVEVISGLSEGEEVVIE